MAGRKTLKKIAGLNYWELWKGISISVAALLLLSPTKPFPSNKSSKNFVFEICDNALDDDGDGLIDLNDPDCDCPVIEPKSLIPNPSFEEMNCCPNNISQLDCADTWIQASEPTTDYLHTCGWMGWSEFPPPLPFPDGKGAVGFRDGRVIQNNAEMNWKEYAGACLISPLEANKPYRIEFEVGFVDNFSSPPINISFFGTTDCNNLPFGVGDPAFGCPTNGPGWVKLSSVYVAGPGWVKSEINVIPDEDIYAIAIGPDCPGVPASKSLYYFFDNLVLADQRSFDFQISEVEHPCSDNFTLSVPEQPGLHYQWYKEGIALVGQTKPVLESMPYGEGNYQVRFTGEDECNVTKYYNYQIPEIYDVIEASICQGDVFRFGNYRLQESGEYVDTFPSANNCDSIVTLRLKVLEPVADTVEALIFEGEKFDVGDFAFKQSGIYDVNLVSSGGCDSLVHLDLGYYQIFFPNVFSPNGDGTHDYFNVFGGTDLITISNLKIFDRWGTVVYESNNTLPNESGGWDGRHNGNMLDSGVYTYMANIMMNDGLDRKFYGTVLLVR